VQFTPVPNPLLAGLLEEIDDIGELKLTLRVIWALHRKKAPLPYVTASEMCEDRSVAAMLGVTGVELERGVRNALSSAVRRGTLLEVDAAGGDVRYLLNTEPVRKSLVRRGIEMPEPHGGPGAETPQAEEEPGLHTGVFRVYEENIGALTPLVAESISATLSEHPESDVIDAIKVAVERNARSWKYVTAVLRRWAAEGRAGRETDGKPERHSEANRSDEFIEKYLERQRSRGNP
jgi:DnaD/phage-associated family protein